MDTCRTPLTAALAILLASLVPKAALANSAPFIAPFTDQTVLVGETLQFRVIPTDKDLIVPALHVNNPPPESRFIDNRDGSRSFLWTPTVDDAGVRYISFTAVDAQNPALSHTRELKVRIVRPDGSTGNQPPALIPLADRQTRLGERFDFQVAATDPDGTVAALTVTPLPVGASLVDNHDGSRQFLWTPTALSHGIVNLTFTATDADEAILRDSQSLTLRVVDADGTALPGVLGSLNSSAETNNNRAPIIPPLAPQSIALGQSADFTVRALDVDGTVPLLAIPGLPEGASFNDNGDGSHRFRWTPGPEDLGDTRIRIEAIDAMDPTLGSQLEVTLNVFRDPGNPVNFPPQIQSISNPLIRTGDTLNQRLKAFDADGTVPGLHIMDAPPTANFIDNLDGSRTLRWTSTSEDTGEHTVSLQATDAQIPAVSVSSSFTITVVDPDTLNRPGERLRTLAEQHDIGIGFSAPLNAASLPDKQLFLQLAAEEFSAVTAESSFTMDWVRPQRNTFRFDDADALTAYAESHDLLLHAQPLIEHTSLPSWVQDLAPDDVQAVMREHIEAVVGRYHSRVGIWTVVDQALDSDGRLRESIWTRGMGADYLSSAFALTRAVDASARLIYSDVDVLTQNPKSDALYALLKRELAAGTPIDGVAFQSQLNSEFDDFASARINLQRFADLGLELYITQFEVVLDDEDSLAIQAELYRRTLELCLQQTRCVAVHTRGYTDRYAHDSAARPSLFTDRYQAKPAYEAWQGTLQDFVN